MSQGYALRWIFSRKTLRLGMGQNEGRWQKIVYEKDLRYCTSCSKQGHAKYNCKRRSKNSSATDAANKEKSNQQPSAPNSNASRKKSAQGQGGKAPPRQVYRPTGNTICDLIIHIIFQRILRRSRIFFLLIKTRFSP